MNYIFEKKIFMKHLFFLVLLLSPYFLLSQKRLELVHNNAFSFYDYEEKSFYVLDDSTFIWRYNVKKEKWEKEPLELKIEMPFSKFLTDFIVMSDQGTPVYFVYKGCGVVYAKKRNEIFRHDHSFYHMNQFGGAFFMDEGEPKIYGGYGLFTHKNIITRYDTLEREWFLIETPSKVPPIGFKNMFHKNKNHFYVFNGLQLVQNHFQTFNDIWSFDLVKNKWTNLGRLNLRVLSEDEECDNKEFQMNQSGFLCYTNVILKFDFQQMKFRKYKFKSSGLYKNIVNMGDLYLLVKSTSKPSRFIEISDSKFLDDFDMEEGVIKMGEKCNCDLLDWVQFGLIVGFLSMIILFLIRKNKNKNKKRNKEMNVNSFYNSNEFNQLEIQLLELLLENREKGLEISQINDFVNYDDPSADTLKKRREILMKDLRYKLASKYHISQEEVFIERRMEKDKRMKLLVLNENISNHLNIPK
jgi:hypothetical protein